MRRHRRLCCASFLATAGALLALPLPAYAGLLAPGQTQGGEAFVLNLGDPSFAGETLLTETRPFEIDFEQPEGGAPNSVSGTFTHLVIRESATGQLAFHYRLQQTGAVGGVIDFENLAVSGFSGFTTDVFSDQTSLTQARASRSADGDTITFVGDEEPFSGNFVVRTNATAFDTTGGSTVVFATAQTGDPIGGPDRTITFVTAAAVPLPPSVWAALATMGGLGALKAARRLKRPA